MKNNMIFIFGIKITLWKVWFSNTFQTNNVVVPFKFIILIFLKNTFLGGFSWKRYFICWRCFRRCWVNCWYWFQCFNQSKPFLCSPFFRNLPSNVALCRFCTILCSTILILYHLILHCFHVAFFNIALFSISPI